MAVTHPFMSPAMYYSSMGYPQPGFPLHPSGFSAPPSSFVSHQGFASPQGLTPGLPTTATSALSSQPLKYPSIQEWIEYCDQHPDCSGADLTALLPKLQAQGFRHINQLASDHMTIEKLVDWLSVGPGTADLIIRYAEEDCRLVAAGTFQMELGASA